MLTEKEKRFMEDIQAFLFSGGESPHASDNGVALKIASKSGRVEVVKALLDAGAGDCLAQDSEALMNASIKGYVDIAKLLLDAGANVREDNDLALRLASEAGHADMVSVLLKAGANVHAGNDISICLASKNGHTETAKVLLHFGADVRCAYPQGAHANDDEALRWALKKDHAEVLEILLDAGVSQGTPCVSAEGEKRRVWVPQGTEHAYAFGIQKYSNLKVTCYEQFHDIFSSISFTVKATRSGYF